MNEQQMILAIIIMSAVTVAIRFLPFLIFGSRQSPEWINRLASSLPGAVMGMLVIYCLKGIRFTSPGKFLPELIAGAVVVVSFRIKRNTLLSIIAGTVCYMALVQTVFS